MLKESKKACILGMGKRLGNAVSATCSKKNPGGCNFFRACFVSNTEGKACEAQ